MPIVISLVSLLMIGVPIAFLLAIIAILLIVYQGDQVLFLSFQQQFFAGLENYGLLALPLFILVGELMSASGMASRLVRMAAALIGPVRGGLAYVNLISNGFMASILGSAVAQISLMTQVMTPEMQRNGYRKDFAVSLSAAGGLLAPILPPSMMFVVYGVLAQISIGDLFITGLVPGAMMLLGFFAYIAWRARRDNFPLPLDNISAPNKQPSQLPELQQGQEQTTKTSSKLGMLRQGLPALLIPLVIVFSILGGLATPTEAAALAAIVTIIVGKFIYRDFDWQHIPAAFKRAAISSGVILILIGSAQVMGFVLSYQQIPLAVAQWISQVADSPLEFLLLLNVLLLFIGMFIDAIAALIIVVPILLPIAMNHFGINPYHFGLVVCLNLALGLLTPPVGAGLFVASSTSGESVEKISRGVLPFVLITVLILLLLSVFPGLSSLLL